MLCWKDGHLMYSQPAHNNLICTCCNSKIPTMFCCCGCNYFNIFKLY